MAGTNESPDLLELGRDLVVWWQGLGERLTRWYDENREGIEDTFAWLEALAEVQPELEAMWDRWEGSRWGHLLWKMDFTSGLALIAMLEGQHQKNVERVLEPALTDPQLHAKVVAALEQAPLPRAHRRQLRAGLDYVAQRDYELAVPLLIIPLEGAFARVAKGKGLVERIGNRLNYTTQSGQTGAVRNIHGLVKLPQMGVDEDFRLFIKGLVYGGEGQEFRHGIAETGWRQRALLLVVGLVGWLDLYADTKKDSLLLEAFNRNREAVGQLIDAA